MEDIKFLPFYERIAIRLPGNITGKVLVSLLPSLVFLTAHYVSIKEEVFKDWSWFLSVLISTAMLCLYYATHTLRTILTEMDMRLQPDGEGVYLTTLKRVLSDRNFVLAGLFFGLLNCGFGLCFGLPYTKWFQIVTILSGYLLAGFVCGMAAFGIFGVCLSIRAFARKAKRTLDFTSPDHCGGTVFLGGALVVFSSVTLIVGVMISAYILLTPWENKEENWIQPLMYFWIAFPYVMSLVALIVPAVPINKALSEYKVELEVLLQERVTNIRKRLEGEKLDAAQRSELRADYEFQQNIREHLQKMRTWPYSLSANIKYLIVFLANLAASVATVLEWMKQS